MLLSLGILMIIGVVVLFAFTVSFGADYTFTLEYFKEGVINSNVMVNSWVASMSTAAISTVFGIALAFLVLRKKFPGRTVMDFLAMLHLYYFNNSRVVRFEMQVKATVSRQFHHRVKNWRPVVCPNDITK